MNFIGEHLLPGQVGHLFLILAFAASLVAVVANGCVVFSTDVNQKANWLKLARLAFLLQSASILIVFGSIFYICSSHLYEYMYAYKHASKELEAKYLLACIWEGQEGSFLLWCSWHCVIGIFFIAKKHEWEAPVMAAINLAQFFMLMMLLGIYFGEVRIGNSLFALTRNEIAAPIFSQPNYLDFIRDGMGLNVLLRNYWMVIHPPVLFLGFALSIVPFAFCCGALVNKKYAEWIAPALPWVLAATTVLGVGIMMGGKWAYESLSFGGYWAWDPVENASLVPWMILVAALHTMLISKATGHSLRAAFLFNILAFAFVLYSTFLTKTGILGDASVHSFTDPGRAINMMITLFLSFFSIGSLALFFSRFKHIPQPSKEENANSREFWMFIGALVFFLSAMFIIAKTSVPLVNKLFGSSIAPPEDVEFSYNKVIVMVAIIIGVLTAIAQYFKYQRTGPDYLKKYLWWPALLSIAATTLLFYLYPLRFYKHGPGFLAALYGASFACIFALIANAAYIWKVQKGKMIHAGGSLSHAGFALMLVGMIISSANKEVISSSAVNGLNMPASIDPMTRKQDDPRENLTLIRNLPTRMGSYEVTYSGDSSGQEKGRRFFAMRFERKNKDGSTAESFTLRPDVYQMKDNNMSSNPDTRSYPGKDVFTYLTYAINKSAVTDTNSFTIHDMKPGDTAYYSKGMFILEKVLINPEQKRVQLAPGNKALMAQLSFSTKDSFHFAAHPILYLDKDNNIFQADDTIYSNNLFVQFAGVKDDQHIRIGIKESTNPIDFITVKAYVFPYINLVWLGLILMGIGIALSMLKRANLGKGMLALCLLTISAALFYMFLFAN